MYQIVRIEYEDEALRQEAMREARAQRLILRAQHRERNYGISSSILLALASLIALILGTRS